MDGKREEVLPFLDRLGSGDRAQDHRFAERRDDRAVGLAGNLARFEGQRFTAPLDRYFFHVKHGVSFARRALCRAGPLCPGNPARGGVGRLSAPMAVPPDAGAALWSRSEEHTSELQSLMRISYAVFCLKKKNTLHSIALQLLY